MRLSTTSGIVARGYLAAAAVLLVLAASTLAARADTSGLSMVTVPYTFTNSDAEYVFQVLGPLSPGNSASLIRWDPTVAAYRWFPNPFVTNMVPGRGYWLLNSLGTTVVYPLDATAVSTATSYPVPLQQGWNQVGSPFLASQPFTSLQVTDSTNHTYSMLDAIGRGLVLGTLFSFNPTLGEYEWVPEPTNLIVHPNAGYWILAYDEATLKFTPPSLTASTQVPAQPTGSPGSSPDNWRVGLVVAGAGQHKGARYFGVAPTAEDARDAGDIPSPPAALTSGVTLQSSFMQSGAPFVQDLHKPGSSAAWRLAVTTDAADEIITLAWPDLSELPAKLTAVLEDTAAGRRCFMRTAGSYSFNSGPQGGTREFTITVKPRGAASMVVSSATVAQGGAGFEVGYTLSADASVDIEIRNISGVLVRQLSSGLSAPAGTNVAPWDGRNTSGAQVPGGRYLCKITARSAETGQASNLVRAFMVAR